MIDLASEQLVTLHQASKLLPAIDALPGMEARPSVHWRTVYNWATRGKRGIVLETASLGGILTTSKEALGRFFSRVTVARQTRLSERDHETIRRRTVRRRDGAHLAAMERLRVEHGL